MTGKRQSGIDWINIGKYGMAAVFVIYIVILLFMGRDSKAPFDTVERAVQEAANTGNTEEAGAREIKKYYGFYKKDFEGISLYTSKDAMGAEELLLLRVKQDEQMGQVKEAVEKRVETQINNFEGYGAKQTKLIKSAVIEQKGKYLLFIISPNADSVRKAFLKAL